MVKAEAHVLSSAALTRVLSHLHLRDPDAHLDKLLEPVAEDLCKAAAATVQGQVETLLGKFRGFVSDPLSGDVVDPAAGGEGENIVAHGGAPSAGDGDIQGDLRLFFSFHFCDIHQASWRRLDFSFGIVRTIWL